MTIDSIYDWLINHAPKNGTTAIWQNLASHIMLMNELEPDNVEPCKVEEIKSLAEKYQINIPDETHRNIMSELQSCRA